MAGGSGQKCGRRACVSRSVLLRFHERTIDPNRGFLATRVVERTPQNGLPDLEVNVIPSLVAVPGGESIWLPTSIEETIPGRPRADGGSPAPFEHLVRRYTSIEVNPDLPASTFSLAFLHSRDGTMVEKIAADGKRETLVMVDSEALPRDVARRILTAKRLPPAVGIGAPKRNRYVLLVNASLAVAACCCFIFWRTKNHRFSRSANQEKKLI